MGRRLRLHWQRLSNKIHRPPHNNDGRNKAQQNKTKTKEKHRKRKENHQQVWCISRAYSNTQTHNMCAHRIGAIEFLLSGTSCNCPEQTSMKEDIPKQDVIASLKRCSAET